MSIRVKIPAVLQEFTNDQGEVFCDGNSIKSLFRDLDVKFPGFTSKVYEDNGRLQQFISVFVNDESIAKLNGELTHLEDGDEVMIISALSNE